MGYLRRLLPSMLLMCFLLVSSYVAWQKPSYNWDALGYVGSMYALEHREQVQIHEYVYACAEKTMSKQNFQELTTDGFSETEVLETAKNGYRATMRNNPASFAQQLPFYNIKMLYIGMLYVVSKSGMNPFHAAKLISILSTFIIGIVMYLWIQKYAPLLWSLIWSGLLLLGLGIQDMIGLVTPDLLCGMFLLSGLYSIYEKKRCFVGSAFFVLSVLTRPDSMIFIFMIIGQMYFLQGVISKKHFYLLSLMVASIVTVAMMNTYSWSTLFYHTFIDSLIDPATGIPSLPVSSYLQVVIMNLRLKSPSNVVVVFAVLGVTTMLFKRAFRLENKSIDGLFSMTLLYMVIRFFMFPSLSPRFLIISYLTVGIVFVAKLGEVLVDYPVFVNTRILYHSYARIRQIAMTLLQPGFTRRVLHKGNIIKTQKT